jgi:hypothetical protein
MSRKSTIFDCSVLELPKVHSRAGNITPIHSNINVPFDIKRVYYLYDVPGGEARGGHGHKDLRQLIIAASGSFDVLLDDGKNKRVVNLNRPYYGLLMKPGLWRELMNFSSGAICLVLASHIYDEDDYIRDYNDFISYKQL